MSYGKIAGVRPAFETSKRDVEDFLFDELHSQEEVEKVMRECQENEGTTLSTGGDLSVNIPPLLVCFEKGKWYTNSQKIK